ncbi:primosomal replication protein [Cronobacter turicensis]|uniref:primosomal replication protein n=1 Tax=Cronobacter turicensis TaxID=413502 RepID=UPI001D3B5CC8|nr:primosomal replication protein [Cronobacter turicensis]EGT4493254.1 primosomal protein [Cronobacter turicensis]EKM0438423.1 primosomal replication protein [Cronobacter turicensis]ELY4323321.1 primosomal replication protein [Cronobacter turicensis]ELY5945028.1 primosomal replication protein [Cronobacter turicensis]ELY5963139.1 primosomal replication protein [Cronobacter turicensis]
MRTPLLLQSLKTRVATLRELIEPLASQRHFSPRFDRQLFSCSGARLGDYLAEAQESLTHLEAAVTQGDAARVAWLAERLAAQIEALQREAATATLRRHENAHLPGGRLHGRLAEYQEYERRLLAMKTGRERRCAENHDPQLAREIDALNERLARCRTAIARTERALERITR